MPAAQVFLTLVILLIAVGASLGSISSFVPLDEGARETASAYRGAQRALARMRAEDFAQLVERYNDEPNDDPGGPGTAPGSGFVVESLAPQLEDADGLVGRILLPVLVDRAVEPADRLGDYELLPVRVRVEWRGMGGDRSVEVQAVLRN